MEIKGFRQISDSQREAAARVLIDALVHAPAAWKTMEEAAEEVATFFTDEERLAFAAIEAGRLVGWVGAIRSYSHAWEMHPLVVAPHRQRRGVGRALVAALEAEAVRAGVLTIHLGSDDDSGGTSLFGKDLYPDVLGKAAAVQITGRHPLSFYRRLGYVVTGVLPDANGPGRPDIFMAKRIGA
jgi:GNAT superfamily N-acetyltransferase